VYSPVHSYTTIFFAYAVVVWIGQGTRAVIGTRRLAPLRDADTRLYGLSS